MLAMRTQGHRLAPKPNLIQSLAPRVFDLRGLSTPTRHSCHGKWSPTLEASRFTGDPYNGKWKQSHPHFTPFFPFSAHRAQDACSSPSRWHMRSSPLLSDSRPVVILCHFDVGAGGAPFGEVGAVRLPLRFCL